MAKITKEEYDTARKTVVDYELQQYEDDIWERGLFVSPNRRKFEGKRNKQTNEYFFILRDDYRRGSSYEINKVVDSEIIKTWEKFIPSSN